MTTDAFADLLGITISTASDGSVSARHTVGEGHLNPHGTTHGAFLFALAGTALAAAANTEQHSGVVSAVQIDYLAPTGFGNTITATVTIAERLDREDLFDIRLTRSAGTDIVGPPEVVIARGRARDTTSSPLTSPYPIRQEPLEAAVTTTAVDLNPANSLHGVIHERERQRYAAMLAGDVDALTRLLSPSLSYTHTDGARDDRTSYLQKVEDKTFVYLSVDHTANLIEPMNNNTVIVVGEMHCQAKLRGQPISLHNGALAIWGDPEAGWRLVFYKPWPLNVVD